MTTLTPIAIFATACVLMAALAIGFGAIATWLMARDWRGLPGRLWAFFTEPQTGE